MKQDKCPRRKVVSSDYVRRGFTAMYSCLLVCGHTVETTRTKLPLGEREMRDAPKTAECYECRDEIERVSK